MAQRLFEEDMLRRERCVGFAVQALMGRDHLDVVSLADAIHQFVTGADAVGEKAASRDVK